MKPRKNGKLNLIRMISLSSFFLAAFVSIWRWIAVYNEKVFATQQALANTANGIANFGISNCGLNSGEMFFFWFFLSLAAFTLTLFFTKRIFLSSLFSIFIIINLITNDITTTYFYYSDLLENYFGIDWYDNYLFIEAVLLFLIMSFSFAEAFLISRFVDKKFHAKISFR